MVRTYLTGKFAHEGFDNFSTPFGTKTFFIVCNADTYTHMYNFAYIISFFMHISNA